MITHYAGILLEKNPFGSDYFFKDLALAKTHDPRSSNTPRRIQFMQKHGLSESRSRVYPHWLALLPAGMKKATYHGWRAPEELHRLMDETNVCDHDILFVRKGRYVYTTQPYDMTLRGYQAVEDYWSNLGLFVGISIQDAWWYPGSAPLVVISQEPVELTDFQPKYETEGLKAALREQGLLADDWVDSIE